MGDWAAMKQQRRHAWLGILISALIATGLMTGCVEGVAQGLSSQQTASQTALPASSVEPSPVAATAGATEGSTASSNALEDRLEVHFIDVGQADAILVKQGSSAMLVDAGNNEDADLVVQYLKNQGISKLDYVIGTHPHEDHIGGLDAVIRTFQVGKIIMPKAVTTTKTYEEVLTAIQQKGLKITAPVPGTKYELGHSEFTVLAPNSSSYESLNNYSVVVRLVYGGTSFLLAGDAEDVSEKEMQSKGFTLDSDVLKVGHHGSSTSTTQEFLKAVDPKYAVISVGQGNSYGHPSSSIIKRLQDRGMVIYRTDENGTVIAVSDGTAMTFTASRDSRVNAAAKASAAPAKASADPAPAASAVSTPSQTMAPKKSGGVEIISVDLEKEIVALKNTSSADIDLSGWSLLSVKGGQTFTFPQGTVIKAGATLTIASGDAVGDIKWSNKNIWNNDGDPARLIDANGNIVSEY